MSADGLLLISPGKWILSFLSLSDYLTNINSHEESRRKNLVRWRKGMLKTYYRTHKRCEDRRRKAF